MIKSIAVLFCKEDFFSYVNFGELNPENELKAKLFYATTAMLSPSELED